MNEPQTILELFGKRPSVVKPGLERIRSAWNVLGNPGADTKTVLVGGTNGKGSTSGMLWHMLAGLGVRAGYFSSPHLIEFRERIAVSGCEVTNGVLVAHLEEIRQKVGSEIWNELTFFEINTLLALYAFARFKTEINVLEVGLGGRLDCTNIVEPCLSMITSIGLDHVQILGSTTEDIAREKAGIMRRGVVCLWGGAFSSDVSAHQMIHAQASKIGADLKQYGEDFACVSSTEFRLGSRVFNLPSRVRQWPSFLQRNFAMAAAALDHLFQNERSGFPLTASDAIDECVRRFGDPLVPWPTTLWGRFQHVTIERDGVSRQLLLDVCHNPHGAQAFAKGLEEVGLVSHEKQLPALISILSDKDASGIWAALEGKISEAFLFEIGSERSWQAGATPLSGRMFPSFPQCLHAAMERQDWAQPSMQPWLVCGSVAAVGEVFRYFRDLGWGLRDTAIRNERV